MNNSKDKPVNLQLIRLEKAVYPSQITPDDALVSLKRALEKNGVRMTKLVLVYEDENGKIGWRAAGTQNSIEIYGLLEWLKQQV